MDGEHEVEARAPSSADNAQPKGMAAPVVLEEATDPWLVWILEYLQASLDKQDALQANLSAANADLMAIAYKLAAAIKAASTTNTTWATPKRWSGIYSVT